MRFLVLLFLSGCGYQWRSDPAETQCKAIYVPLIVGDEDGTLTSQVIYAITASGLAAVHPTQAPYLLEIAILDTKSQAVGYRLDQQQISGKTKTNIVACEARRTMTLEATLYHGSTILRGPCKITADVDYDYVDGDSIEDLTFINTAGILTPVLSFSLGQLESVESAQEASQRPLNERLAQKIVDVMLRRSF